MAFQLPYFLRSSDLLNETVCLGREGGNLALGVMSSEQVLWLCYGIAGESLEKSLRNLPSQASEKKET